jgi:hypothetical protein
MLRLVVVSGGSVALVYLFVQAGDQFSTWIIDQSLRCVTVNGHQSRNDFSANLAAMMAVGALTTGVIAVWGAIVMGSLAIFASLIQVILMVLRGAMLVIGLGVLPAAYANFMTESGRYQHRKALTWLTALVLYKPAAAIVYAAGFKLAGTSMWESGVVSVISGMMVLADGARGGGAGVACVDAVHRAGDRGDQPAERGGDRGRGGGAGGGRRGRADGRGGAGGRSRTGDAPTAAGLGGRRRWWRRRW